MQLSLLLLLLPEVQPRGRRHLVLVGAAAVDLGILTSASSDLEIVVVVVDDVVVLEEHGAGAERGRRGRHAANAYRSFRAGGG